MGVRIVSANHNNFLISKRSSLWGAKINKLGKWEIGDIVVFRVDKLIAGYSVILGKSFYSEEKVWEDDIYPYRIELTKWRILPDNKWFEFNDEIKLLLKDSWGDQYGVGLVSNRLLEPEEGRKLIGLLDEKF